MPTLYGIPNCDTVKKARTWLTQQGQDYVFVDFKKQGVPVAKLETWLANLGWETVINRKGTAWRALDEVVKASVVDAASARAVALNHASIIKRPVVEWDDGRTTIGFDPQTFAAALQG